MPTIHLLARPLLALLAALALAGCVYEPGYYAPGYGYAGPVVVSPGWGWWGHGEGWHGDGGGWHGGGGGGWHGGH